LSANAMPLVIMSGVPFEDPEMFPMATGDMMVLVTDGFFEWHDHSKEQYGMERLYRVLRRNRDRPCADIIDALYRDVIGFAGGTKQADDLTAVIIKRR
jgi:phosphoserine phosphatase